MYGIFTYIWVVFGVYVGKYTIQHLGIKFVSPLCSNPFCKWYWSGFWVFFFYTFSQGIWKNDEICYTRVKIDGTAQSLHIG